MKRRAMVAGTAALDMIPQFPASACRRDEILMEGKTVYLPDIQLILGGCVSNTGIAMHRLGAEVILCSKVGGDPLAGVVRQMLEESGAEVRLAELKGHATSATVVVAPEGSDRSFWHRRGASQVYALSDIPADAAERCDLFHFGYPTGMACMYGDGGVTLADLYGGIKRMGLTTSMDLSLPGLTSESARADWKTILRRVLPCVDVFLPSLEELLLLLHRPYYMEVLQRAGADCAVRYADLSILPALADEVLAMGPKVFGVKLGEKGLYLRTAKKEAFASFGRMSGALSPRWYDRELMELPYRPERFCSANGAGDTAIAGFLTGMMEGCGPEDCLRLAAGAAACRIETGHQGIPSAREVLERARAGWENLGAAPEGGWAETAEGLYASPRDSLQG